MNLILSDVEETITLVDVGDDGAVTGVRVSPLTWASNEEEETNICLAIAECCEKHGDAVRSRGRRDHGKLDLFRCPTLSLIQLYLSL
jgi:hypothetical protein